MAGWNRLENLPPITCRIQTSHTLNCSLRTSHTFSYLMHIPLHIIVYWSLTASGIQSQILSASPHYYEWDFLILHGFPLMRLIPVMHVKDILLFVCPSTELGTQPSFNTYLQLVNWTNVHICSQSVFLKLKLLDIVV